MASSCEWKREEEKLTKAWAVEEDPVRKYRLAERIALCRRKQRKLL